MDITVEGVIVHNPHNIEKVQVKLTELNHIMVRAKLEHERRKLIEYLKKLKTDGIIKSNYRPKNKKIQPHLDEICKENRKIKKTIRTINDIYN